MFLSVAMIFTYIPVEAVASEIEKQKEDDYSIGQLGGYLAANKSAVYNMKVEAKFNTATGHGFCG